MFLLTKECISLGMLQNMCPCKLAAPQCCVDGCTQLSEVTCSCGKTSTPQSNHPVDSQGDTMVNLAKDVRFVLVESPTRETNELYHLQKAKARAEHLQRTDTAD